jgi:hypothetical protein
MVGKNTPARSAGAQIFANMVRGGLDAKSAKAHKLQAAEVAVAAGRLQSLLSEGTSMVKSCASITVSYIVAAIAAELGYAFTRDGNTVVLIAGAE